MKTMNLARSRSRRDNGLLVFFLSDDCNGRCIDSVFLRWLINFLTRELSLPALFCAHLRQSEHSSTSASNFPQSLCV